MNKLTKAAFAAIMAVAIGLFSVGSGCTTVNNVSITTSQDISPKVLYRDLNLPTVLVQAQDGSSGSGVVLGDLSNYLLTAAHVVMGPSYDEAGNYLGQAAQPVVALKNLDGTNVFLSQTTLVKLDEKLDLAVLKLETPWIKSASISVRGPVLYEKCWVSGHPLGVTDTTITDGLVQDLDEDGFVRYSALSIFGNSGGPVFLMDNGSMVVFSICQRVFMNNGYAVTHMGLGVKHDKLVEFLKGAF